MKFLENLGFTSTNDRLFIGILKDLGFLNRDGAPQPRYFEFLDRTRSKQVLAQAIREAFSEVFAINTRANELSVEELKNKLRTLYAGTKTDLNIAKTFRALCDYADFTMPPAPQESAKTETPTQPVSITKQVPPPSLVPPSAAGVSSGKIAVSGLQYHINIVLPDTRDQAVYDAIFKSVRKHLV